MFTMFTDVIDYEVVDMDHCYILIQDKNGKFNRLSYYQDDYCFSLDEVRYFYGYDNDYQLDDLDILFYCESVLRDQYNTKVNIEYAREVK